MINFQMENMLKEIKKMKNTEYHKHSDYYRYTGKHKKIDGEEVFEYKCSECGKEVWVGRAEEAPFKYEKEETICWDV